MTGAEPRVLRLHKDATVRNQEQAKLNRERFRQHGLLVVNLLSSPGAGKTRLLERTLADLAHRFRMGVIVGDLETDRDARRLRVGATQVVQITTGTLCHLEASMIDRSTSEMDLAALDILFIENVGNLVCPSGYDLGESLRVALLSVTEGEDKPLKYPTAFRPANSIIITKCDLLVAAEFDRTEAIANIRQVSPTAPILELSAKTGEGMEGWYQYLSADRGSAC